MKGKLPPIDQKKGPPPTVQLHEQRRNTLPPDLNRVSKGPEDSFDAQSVPVKSDKKNVNFPPPDNRRKTLKPSDSANNERAQPPEPVIALRPLISEKSQENLKRAHIIVNILKVLKNQNLSTQQQDEGIKSLLKEQPEDLKKHANTLVESFRARQTVRAAPAAQSSANAGTSVKLPPIKH